MSWIFLALLALVFVGPLGVLLSQVDQAALSALAESGVLTRVLSTTAISALGGAAISVVAAAATVG